MAGQMNSSQQHSNSPDDNVSSVGLVAIGRAGDWEVSVDETTSGADKWFAQIEGPSVYLYFEIASPGVIEEVLRFLDSPEAPSIDKRGDIEVGTFNETSVTLLRDDEFADRYFFCIGGIGKATVRISVLGDNLKALSTAVRQVRDELEE